MPTSQRTELLVRHPTGAGIGRAFLVLLLAVATVLGAAARADGPDYALLDDVLLNNVRNGYVDYDGIAADPRFRTFLDQLASGTAGETREERLAYYINAYNAFAISGILEGRSPAGRMGRSRFYRDARFRLAGAETALETLELEHIRPLAEPRAHFALACATLSCPRLWNHAYRPAGIDVQLDDATRRFVNDVTRNRFDIPQRTAFVSDIFERHAGDFERSGGSVAAWLARYVSEPATRAALVEGRLTLAYLPRDWELNGRYEGPEPR